MRQGILDIAELVVDDGVHDEDVGLVGGEEDPKHVARVPRTVVDVHVLVCPVRKVRRLVRVELARQRVHGDTGLVRTNLLAVRHVRHVAERHDGPEDEWHVRLVQPLDVGMRQERSQFLRQHDFDTGSCTCEPMPGHTKLPHKQQQYDT
jgi:hypothetical protein